MEWATLMNLDDWIDGWKPWIVSNRRFMAKLAICGAAVTLLIVSIWLFIGSPKQGCLFQFARFLTLLWAVLPPSWFFLEWWAWAPPSPEAGSENPVPDVAKRPAVDAFNEFKYTQEVAAKIWIGFAGVLAVLFALK
jgi:hypothetical protein